MKLSKRILMFLIPTLLFSEHIHKEQKQKCPKKAEKKINCRWICNKKVYREREIAKAISFYKKSKYYSFK